MVRKFGGGRRVAIGRLLLALSAVGWGLSVARAEPSWRAGLARAVITPTEPVWLAGYSGRDRPAEGKLHDLWVKVLALEDAAGARAVVITCDLLGFSRRAWQAIGADIEAQHGLRASHVLLTVSHTHSGPVTEDCLLDYYPLDAEQMARVGRHSRQLQQTIVGCVGAALGRLAPARLTVHRGEARFAVNRRANREAEVPELLARGAALAGPVDHGIRVLAVRSEAGDMRGVVFQYACHNTTLDGYAWCGDWAGFAQADLEEALPDVQAMFITGCGADQNPLPRRKIELCQRYGAELAAGVRQALAEQGPQVAPRWRGEQSTVPLAFERLVSPAEIAVHLGADSLRGRWARRLQARLNTGETFATEYPYTVQVWRLGEELLWVNLAGEVVLDYALRLGREIGPDTWANAYAHDLVAYIPSRRVWEEGGYEGGSLYEYGLPAERWAGDQESQIMAEVLRLVESLRR